VAHVVLIGPIGVGKWTVAPLVASLTGRAMVSMDDVRFDNYRRAGYHDALAATFASTGDIAGLIGYWRPGEADAVEHLVVDHTEAARLPAGHADYPDGPLLDRVAAALADRRTCEAGDGIGTLRLLDGLPPGCEDSPPN
jgi:hypothetical protein